MGLIELFLAITAPHAPDFLGATPSRNYKKIKDMAETILDSTSATTEQRQKANKWLKEANRRLK